MPLNLRHKNWESTGRTFELLDDKDQPTGKLVWSGKVGEQCVQDGQGDWHPYIHEGDTIKYGQDGMQFDLATDRQIIKRGASKLCESLKIFVQREVAGEWVTVNHGPANRQFRHNKRFQNSDLIDDEGYCVGWLSFPSAPYTLQVGLQAGRSSRTIFGFRFQAAQSGRIRFQIVKDGIEGKPAGLDLIREGGGPRGREERTTGLRWKNFFWRWTWEEAALRDVSLEDSTNYPGLKKGIITVGPFDYVANDWIKVTPDTWGLTEAADDAFTEGSTFYSDYAGNLYLGQYSSNQDHPGMTWSNVTAHGTAENGCYIRVRVTTSNGAGGEGNLKAIDARAVTTFSGGYLPVTDTPEHANSVYFQPGTTEQYVNSGEIKTIIQDRFDDDHQSGDEIGIVCESVTVTNNHTAFAAIENATYPAPQLYIVYTTGGGSTVVPVFTYYQLHHR